MDRTFFELREALGKPGCFLCRLEEAHTRRFLETLFYEFVTDRGARESIRTGGFCREHTQKLFTLRPSVLGIAIVYQDLVHRYLLGEIPDPKRCPVCQDWEDHFLHIAHLLARNFEDLTPFWGKETFLCLPHLTRFSGSLRDHLEKATKAALQRISVTLSSFIEKFDYHKSRLPVEPEEARSWQEAMEFFAGGLMGGKGN